VEAKEQLDSANTKFWNTLEIVAPLFYEAFIKKRTCIVI
jgi:hypothetical protein